jgi:glucose-1-phosphate adenylyltransferase
VDAHNILPPNTVIGYDRQTDAERYHLDEKSGIVVVGMPSIKLRHAVDIPIQSMGESVPPRSGSF